MPVSIGFDIFVVALVILAGTLGGIAELTRSVFDGGSGATGPRPARSGPDGDARGARP